MRSTEPSHTFWKTHRSLQAFDLLRALINSFFKVFSRVLGIASVHQSMIAKFMAVHQQRFKATLVASGELAHEHECRLRLRSQVDWNNSCAMCGFLCPKKYGCNGAVASSCGRYISYITGVIILQTQKKCTDSSWVAASLRLPIPPKKWGFPHFLSPWLR